MEDWKSRKSEKRGFDMKDLNKTEKLSVIRDNENPAMDESVTLFKVNRTEPDFPEDPDIQFPADPELSAASKIEPESETRPAAVKKTAPNRNNKPKKRAFAKDMTPWNIVLTLADIVLHVVVIYSLFYTTRFSALDKDVFTKVNLVTMAVLLVLDILVWISIRTKKIIPFVISALALVVSVSAGGYAAYALTRVETNLTEITAKEHDTDINVSLVTYTKRSGEPIMEVADLNGKRIGGVDGTDCAKIGKDRLTAEEVNYNYVNYLSFAETFKALISEEIDCAILPANYANAIGTEEVLEPYISDTAALITFRDSVVQEGTDGAEKDLTAEPFTVLITGENEGLADTIIIVSVNPVSMKVTMTSIARDSYVPITCYGYASSKINSAHAVSEACLVDTVQYMTGIDIDYTVEFNFASVIQVVDAVGGVDVYNPVEFIGQCWDVASDSLVTLPIPQGYVHLNGQQALGFVRERYAFEDGDFARQQHQQEVIEEIVRRVMETRDPNTYLKILDAAGANIRTNLSTDQMVNFVSYAMKKAKRYYDQDNPVGVMNIINSRITGWSAMKWDDSLAMYLYIYFPFEGASYDTYNYVERNLNLYSTPSIPESVSWSAGNEDFVPPAISADWYGGEVGATVIGGPPEEVAEPEPEPAAEVTPEPVPEETPAEPVPETPADGGGEPAPENPGEGGGA